MPKRRAKAIADAAEMVVDGFAVLKQEQGYKIVNLNSGEPMGTHPAKPL